MPEKKKPFDEILNSYSKPAPKKEQVAKPKSFQDALSSAPKKPAPKPAPQKKEQKPDAFGETVRKIDEKAKYPLGRYDKEQNYDPIPGKSFFDPQNLARFDKKNRQDQRKMLGLPAQTPGEVDPRQTQAVKNRQDKTHYASGIEKLKKILGSGYSKVADLASGYLISSIGGYRAGDQRNSLGQPVVGGDAPESVDEAVKSFVDKLKSGDIGGITQRIDKFRSRRELQERSRSLQAERDQAARVGQMAQNPFTNYYMSPDQMEEAAASGSGPLSVADMVQLGFTQGAQNTQESFDHALGVQAARDYVNNMNPDGGFWDGLKQMGAEAYAFLAQTPGQLAAMPTDIAGDLLISQSPDSTNSQVLGAYANVLGKGAGLLGTAAGVGEGAGMIRAGQVAKGAAKIAAETVSPVGDLGLLHGEVPKLESPKVEAPKVEAPTVEVTKVEAPKVEATKVEVPKVEAPAKSARDLFLESNNEKIATEKARQAENTAPVETTSNTRAAKYPKAQTPKKNPFGAAPVRNGNTVTMTINGETRTAVLNEAQLKEWEAEDARYERGMKGLREDYDIAVRRKDYRAQEYIKARMKDSGFNHSADRRRISGLLTAAEERDKNIFEGRLRPGDAVTTPNGEGTVVKPPAFGKVRVKFQDGSESLVEFSDVSKKIAEVPRAEPVETVKPVEPVKPTPLDRAAFTENLKAQETPMELGERQIKMPAEKVTEKTRRYEFKRDRFGDTYIIDTDPKQGKPITIHGSGGMQVDQDILDLVSLDGQRMPNGYTAGENRVIKYLSMSKDEQRAMRSRIKKAQLEIGESMWNNPDGNIVRGDNAYRNAQNKRYWEPLNEKARAFKAKVDKFDSEERWPRTPKEVQGKGLYVFAESDEGQRVAIAGPYHTQAEAEAGERTAMQRIVDEDPWNHHRVKRIAYGASDEPLTVRYPDLKSEGESPFTTPKAQSFREANEAKLEELKSTRKGVKNAKNKQQGGVSITMDDIEYAARSAIKFAYDTGEDIHEALKRVAKELGLGPDGHDAAFRLVKQFDKDHELGLKFKEEAPKVEAPHVEAKETPAMEASEKVQEPTEPKEHEGGVIGFAEQVSGREGLGYEPTEDIVKTAKAKVDSGQIDPQEVYDRLNKGKPVTGEEGAALLYESQKIANRVQETRKLIDETNDPAALADLNDRLNEGLDTFEKYQVAGVQFRHQFHEVGMSLQAAMKEDYSLAALMARAKSANLGPLNEAQKAKVMELSKKLEETQKLLEDAKAKLATEWKARAKESPKPRISPKSKADAIDTIRKYYGITAGQVQEGGFKSKKAGGFNYTISDADRKVARAFKSLANDAIENGAQEMEDITKHIREAIGGSISDEEIMRNLSLDVRKYLLESDVDRIETARHARDLNRAAKFALKTPLQKALTYVGESITATQRSMQAGMDLSAPFIQGRKGLFANPSGWVKAWKPMMQAAIKGDSAALAELADIKQHPFYARSVAAGLDITEPGGRFTKQEEVFAGNLVRTLGSSNVPGVKQYFQALEHSDAAFTAFLNRVRYDTFVKLASAAPDNPAYLRDCANTVNIIFGRGSGEVAKKLGSMPGIGNAIYAPRYTLSQFQYALGVPVVKAETSAGRIAAAKIYGAQALTYGSLVGLAALAGWDVETDSRSTNFGKVKLNNGAYVDIFAKEGQAYRVASQVLYGKENMKGKYTSASSYSAAGTIGSFIQGKLAPLPRNVMETAFGKYEDGKIVPKSGKDYAIGFLPLWVQQSLQDGQIQKMPSSAVAQFFGLDMGKLPDDAPRKEGKAPPLQLTKPGTFGKKLAEKKSKPIPLSD